MSSDESVESQEEQEAEQVVEIIELPSSEDITDLDDEDSFHSNLLQEEDALSEVSSLDSQLSWIQEHYCYASQCR